MLNIDFEQEDWMLEGGCVYADTDLFFPVGSSMKAMKQANEAKQFAWNVLLSMNA
jgi:hypothetical protein